MTWKKLPKNFQLWKTEWSYHVFDGVWLIKTLKRKWEALVRAWYPLEGPRSELCYCTERLLKDRRQINLKELTYQEVSEGLIQVKLPENMPWYMLWQKWKTENDGQVSNKDQKGSAESYLYYTPRIDVCMNCTEEWRKIFPALSLCFMENRNSILNTLCICSPPIKVLSGLWSPIIDEVDFSPYVDNPLQAKQLRQNKKEGEYSIFNSNLKQMS